MGVNQINKSLTGQLKREIRLTLLYSLCVSTTVGIRSSSCQMIGERYQVGTSIEECRIVWCVLANCTINLDQLLKVAPDLASRNAICQF